MIHSAVATLVTWTKQARERSLHLHRFNIGARLTFCFVFIIFAMLVGHAVLLWQFHFVRAQAERLSGVDQELIVVLQAHTNLISYYERLEVLAHSEDIAGLVREVESLGKAVLEDTQSNRNVLSRLPPEVKLDPTILPILEAIQSTLPAQFEAITALAKSRDWEAVRLRLANKVRPLGFMTSALVRNVDREVGEERAQAVSSIGQAQRRSLLIVSLTAVLTLLFAAFLGFAVTRSITQPLGGVMEAAKELGRGEFQHRVAAIGQDELAHLGRVFNDTAGTLRDLYETLYSREAYLAEAQRLSRTGSFGWDLSTGELVWSDETFRIFEYSRTVKPTVALVLQRTHPEDVVLVQQLFDLVSGGGTDWDVEHRLLMPDGSVKYVHVVVHSSTGDKRKSLFVGAVTDTTERKRAEEGLRESEERFRTMADTLPEAIWIRAVSPEKVLYMSPSFERIWGLPLEDLYRNPHLWTEAIQSEDREGIVGMFARWTAGEDVNYQDVEYRITRPDGAVRWIHDRGVLTFDKHGRPCRASGISADISDRKRAQADLQNALDEIKKLKDQLYEENIALKEEVDKASMFEEIVGESRPLQALLTYVAKVAPMDSTVLVAGETGTGKELIARAIHKRSQRSARAFVSVNCAAIPPSLVASELFGHEKGAFTGAMQGRPGRFELAEGGTIFLDEVGELPPETQITLLRVLQEREFQRVGGTEALRANVRVIAATNRDLRAGIDAGTFRSDLYYRLNVFPIEMPPLRERKEDIPLLVDYFIHRYSVKAGKRIRSISKGTLEMLKSYSWPGNIRELQNVIERSIIVCETEIFRVDESWLYRRPEEPDQISRSLRKIPPSLEKQTIEAALTESRGRVSGPSGAAAQLGVPPSTLDSKIRALKINKHRFKSV